jgi:hypothetical protein
MPLPSSSDREYHDAFVDALIARWFVVDPEGALPAIRELEKKLIRSPGSVWQGSGEFFKAVARVRPEALLGALPEKASWNRSDFTIPAAFTSLATRDPPAARRFLERVADPDQRKAAEIAIAQGIAKNDPLAAVALAHTLNSADVFQAALKAAEHAGAGTLHAVLMANARKFPIGYNLPELVLQHPDEDWSGLVGDEPEKTVGVTLQTMSEAARLTPEERDRRLAGLDRLPPELREKIASALVSAWAKDDPQAAGDWAVAYARGDSQPSESQRVNAAFYQWLQADRAAALAWCAHLPASPLRDELGNNAAAFLARDGKLDEAQALFHPQPGASSAKLIASIAAARGKDDPAAAALWLDSLPPDTDTTMAIKPVLEKWVDLDASAAASWVEAQPAGPRRETALEAYTRAAAELDPAAAGEWAATIADRQARAKAAEYVFDQMDRRDPAAARQWLRALSGVDAAWRERFIRLHR